MSEKQPKYDQKWPRLCAICVKEPENQEPGRILGYVAQIRNARALSPPATHHFLWFPSLSIAERDAYTPVLVVTWWIYGPHTRLRWGPRVGPTGSPGRKKIIFPKLFLDHLGCSNKPFCRGGRKARRMLFGRGGGATRPPSTLSYKADPSDYPAGLALSYRWQRTRFRTNRRHICGWQVGPYNFI